MKWPESRIREEIARLDRQTGLKGAALTIRFNNSRRTLGTFRSKNGEPVCFSFSQAYLECDDYPDSEQLDTIRHEYAHYMVCVRYPGLHEPSHGKHWKKCCQEIGAQPSPYCNLSIAREVRQQEKLQEAERSSVCSLLSDLSPGTEIIHPVLGTGVVTAITPDPDNPRITLSFGENATRLFSARWIIEHCDFA